MFVKAKRTGPTISPPTGTVIHGGIYDIPTEWLELGGWEPVASERTRVTEPAGDPGSLTNAELRKRLTEHGLRPPGGANKATLIDMLLTEEDKNAGK